MRSATDGTEIRSTEEILIAPTPEPEGRVPEAATIEGAEAGTEETGAEQATTEEADTGDAPQPTQTAGIEAATAPENETADGPVEAPSEQTARHVERTAPTPAPQQPTVLLSNESGVRVLQAPRDAAPEVMSSVALDAISLFR